LATSNASRRVNTPSAVTGPSPKVFTRKSKADTDSAPLGAAKLRASSKPRIRGGEGIFMERTAAEKGLLINPIVSLGLDLEVRLVRS
jgi:hypothetical protein